MYKPVGSLSLYANYALSQQPPGGANFQLSTSASNADNPNLDPQKARTIEVGSKWSVLDDVLALNLALFQTSVSNEINTPAARRQRQSDPDRPQARAGASSSPLVGNLTAQLVGVGRLQPSGHRGRGRCQRRPGRHPNLTYTPGDSFTTLDQLPLAVRPDAWAAACATSAGLHRGTDGAVGTPACTGGYGVLDAVASYEISQHAGTAPERLQP